MESKQMHVGTYRGLWVTGQHYSAMVTQSRLAFRHNKAIDEMNAKRIEPTPRKPKRKVAQREIYT